MNTRRLFTLIFALMLLLMTVQVNAFAEENTIQCPRCGESVPNYSNFCLYCGCPLKPVGNPESVLESETGKAEIVGLAAVPDGCLAGDTLDSSQLIMALVQYTNYSEDDRQFQKDFKIKAYQNGVELSNNTGSYYPDKCPKEYNNYSKTVLQNGSITVGRFFVLDDASDVTVIVSFNGSSNKDKAKGTYSLDDFSMVKGAGDGVSFSSVSSQETRSQTKEEKLEADIALAQSVLKDVHLSSEIEYSTLRVYIDFVNPNEKTIKYIDWGIMFINTVGDYMSKPARYSDPNLFICQDTGPYATNEGRHGTSFRWTFYGHEFTQSIWDIAELRLGSVEIEYMDGTKVKINNPEALDAVLK